jgi:hypothetical protein
MISGVLLFVLVFGQFGQTATGELRLTVTDTAGLPVQSAVELVSDANQYRQVSGTSAQGTLVTKRMP